MRKCFFTTRKTMSLIVMVILFFMVTFIMSCLPPQRVWTKPNFTQQEFAKDNYECTQQAQQSKYRASNIGYYQAKGSVETNLQLYNLCMEARGWSLVDQQQAGTRQNNSNSFVSEYCYDIKEVIKNTNAGKEAQTNFTNYRDKKAAMIKDFEKDLYSRKADLEKNGTSMAAAAKEAAESDYQKRVKEYQSLVNNTNDELKKRDREMAEQLAPQILMIVNRIKEKNNYTTVLEKDIDKITCSKDRDITNKIIEECNQYPIVFTPSHVDAEQSNKSETSHSQKMRDLKKIKDEGLITDKEYEQKRKAILDAM